MRKMKQFVALTLAVSLVLGSAMTVFAGDNDGSSTGAGTSEGHVEKKATSVELPTIAEGSTPFAYTMDPEGLIQETSNAKYGSAVEFPAKASDTYVYFNNGKKGGNGTDKDNIVYANTSAAQTVTNKSSHAISLTVTAAASNAATDIPLVAKDAIASASAASLYLGLVVGSEAAVPVSTATAASKTVTINGTPANFKIAVKQDNSGYEYRALTLAEYKALDGNDSKTQDDYDGTWATADFSLEGAVTTGKDITSTTSAPTLTVTWSWVDPSASHTVTYKPGTGATGDDVTESVATGGNPTKATTSAITTFTKEGYAISGWNTKADGSGDAFTNESTVSDDITVFAQWEAIQPDFASTEVGKITYNTAGLKSITKIEFTVNGTAFDGYNALEGAWSAAQSSADASTGKTTITMDSTFCGYYPTTSEGTVTYVGNDDQTKTATVTVTMHE